MAHKFEVYQDKAGKFRFRFRAGNGNIMASSSDAYADKEGALATITNIKAGVPDAELYVDAKGEHRWRMAIEDDVIATGSEGYSAKASAKNGLESVMTRAAEAEVIDA